MTKGKQSDIGDPWGYVMRGEYRQAILIYTRLYMENQHPRYLVNRGIIALKVRDYAAALGDFKDATDSIPSELRSSSHYLLQAVCYWCLDQPTQAIESVWMANRASYADAAGGVRPPALLLYAGERLRDIALSNPALQSLRQHARRKVSPWPGAIAPFLLGWIDVSDFDREAAQRNQETLTGRNRCQADFYVALRALREKDIPTFKGKMTQCAESMYGIQEVECYFARWEVEHHFPKCPFA